MNGSFAHADHAEALREAAERTMARLGLSGYDNASIAAADAWVDTVDFRATCALDLAAYLGEAIIRRHGGSWSLAESGPCVTIDRNGRHVVDPFGRVRKRVLHGREDHLLGLVHLVDHVVKKPSFDASTVARDAFAALAMTERQVPRSAFDALLSFFGIARRPKEHSSSFWKDTLAYEADLTLEPLRQRLASCVSRIHPQSCQDALAEVAFYTAQLHELHAIIACADPSPGRGYVGFDVYGGIGAASRASSWSQYAL